MTKRKTRAKLSPREVMRGGQYPCVNGKVVEWVDHEFEEGVLLPVSIGHESEGSDLRPSHKWFSGGRSFSSP